MKGCWVQASDLKSRSAGCSWPWVILTLSHTPWKVSGNKTTTGLKYLSERLHPHIHIHRDISTGNEEGVVKACWTVMFFCCWIVKRDYRPAASAVCIKLHWVQTPLVLRNTATSWWQLKTAAGEHDRFSHSDCFDISAKIPKYTDIFVQILWPHWSDQRYDSDWIIALHSSLFENVETGGNSAFGDQRNDWSHYFVPEMYAKCGGVTGATVINIPLQKTAKQQFSVLCDSLRFFWWFGFESKGNVDLLHSKINTMKKI